jgi:hypothetical protein
LQISLETCGVGAKPVEDKSVRTVGGGFRCRDPCSPHGATFASARRVACRLGERCWTRSRGQTRQGRVLGLWGSSPGGFEGLPVGLGDRKAAGLARYLSPDPCALGRSDRRLSGSTEGPRRPCPAPVAVPVRLAIRHLLCGQQSALCCPQSVPACRTTAGAGRRCAVRIRLRFLLARTFCGHRTFARWACGRCLSDPPELQHGGDGLDEGGRGARAAR